jgi:fatty acid desaturase
MMPGHDAPPVAAGDLLTLPELSHLRRVSGWRGAGLVLHAWATIIGAMIAYSVWPSAFTLVAAVAVIGARQLGLTVLMHEAAHWRLFSHPRANTLVGQWLGAYPVGAELSGYRRRHHLHHRHTRQPADPDLGLAGPLPAARAVLWRDVLRDLTGVTACAHVLAWRPWREGIVQAGRRWRGPFLVNALLLVGLAALGSWHLYALLWLLPLATWYQVVTRIRNIAEHALVAADDDPLRNTRTVGTGLLARTFVAPYWVNYHLEHHLFVFVPAWKLRQAHELLVSRGYGPRMEMASSYLDVLRRATSTR